MLLLLWNLSTITIVKFSSANGAFFAAAFNKLYYTEPVEAVIAREFASLSHAFLADSTVFCVVIVYITSVSIEINYWVIIIQIFEEASEFSEAIDFTYESTELV